MLGGGPHGTAPPLALDPLLAKLTHPAAGVNPRGEGLLFIVFLPCVHVTRLEVSRVGGARREEGRIMTAGGPSPGCVRRLDAYCGRGPSRRRRRPHQGDWARECLAKGRRLPPCP